MLQSMESDTIWQLKIMQMQKDKGSKQMYRLQLHKQVFLKAHKGRAIVESLLQEKHELFRFTLSSCLLFLSLASKFS